MRRSDRRIIEDIILINPMIGKLQEGIEKEQERVISDMTSPAKKVVERLIALDNRRIDLCNLNVLFAFIRRELGGEFSALERLSSVGADSALYKRALQAIERAGYDLARAEREFAYLFKLIKRPRKPIKPTASELVVGFSGA